MPVTFDPKLAYTKAAYCRAYPQDPKTLDKKIASKDVRSIKINGGVIVLADKG